jgi:hypothetical protein
MDLQPVRPGFFPATFRLERAEAGSFHTSNENAERHAFAEGLQPLGSVSWRGGLEMGAAPLTHRGDAADLHLSSTHLAQCVFGSETNITTVNRFPGHVKLWWPRVLRMGGATGLAQLS